MASSTASAVSHYGVAILNAYRRRIERNRKRRAELEAEIMAIPEAPAPVAKKTAVQRVKKAVPDLDPAIINMAVNDIASQNNQAKVLMEDVKKTIIRLQEELDDEEALAVLL